MDTVLWVVAVLALLMAWMARKRAVELSVRVDDARRQSTSGEADLAEIKQKLETMTKLVELIAAGHDVDPLMVRESRLYRNTNTKQLATLVEQGQAPYVIDVRTPQEWSTGHIPGAVHIPVDQLEKSLHQVKRDGSPMYLVCAGGGRSSGAAQFLSNRGYLNVFNVEGGMTSYKGKLDRD